MNGEPAYTLAGELQGLSPVELVTLFELDLGVLGGPVLYFTPVTNSFKAGMTWQGVAYTPWPIEADGFELSGRGALPRPKIKAANIAGTLSALCLQYADAVGAQCKRKRTLVKYLDAVNFPGGNPAADPARHFATDLFVVDRKSAETLEFVEWELASVFDLAGVKLPRRQVIQNTCLWAYRGAECGYLPNPAKYGQAAAGGIFAADDTPVSSPAADVCGKRLSSCLARFGEGGELPFGGFPAAGKVAEFS